MKGLFSGLMGLLGFGKREERLGPEEFTQAFFNMMRDQAPGLEITIAGPLELKLHPKGQEPQSAFLSNAYKAYEANPTVLDKILHTFVGAFLETAHYQKGQIDTARILPVIKDSRFVEDIRKLSEARGNEGREAALHEPYNSELVVLYVEDTAKTMRYLSSENLKELNMDLPKLRQVALENLNYLLRSPKIKGANGLYMISAGGDYESSLLLKESLWTDSEMDVDGEIVAAIPTRDLLLVTGSNNREGIVQIKKLVAEVMRQAPYGLSHHLFVYRGGKFQLFEKAA